MTALAQALQLIADTLQALRQPFASLAEVAKEPDWVEATELVALIEHRGFQRSRGLAQSLAVLRRDGAF